MRTEPTFRGSTSTVRFAPDRPGESAPVAGFPGVGLRAWVALPALKTDVMADLMERVSFEKKGTDAAYVPHVSAQTELIAPGSATTKNGWSGSSEAW